MWVFFVGILLFITNREISAIELYVPSDINQDCAFIPTDPEPAWVLIARQTVPDYWEDKTWIDRSSNNNASTTFAAWSLLENYRSDDGYFKLKFRWPNLSATKANIWKQTNNPTFQPQNPQTYIQISIDFLSQNSQIWSSGLGRSSSDNTLIQGGSQTWSFAVGQFEEFIFSQAGIRGATPNSIVSQVEVYAMACPYGFRLSSSGNTDICIPGAMAIDSCNNSNSMVNWSIYPNRTDSITDQKCPNAYTISRTWKAVDSCGEQKTGVQTITITDDIVPKITPPDDYESECIVPDVATSGDATALDNCGNVTIKFDDSSEIERGIGYYIINRNWSGTDSCGNTNTAVQKITVYDYIAPALDEPLSDIYLSACGDIDLSTIPTPNFHDNCETPPTISFTDSEVDGTSYCPEKTIYRNWTAVDSFGNSFSVVQLIIITDNIQPIITLPANITILGCKENEDPKVTGFATATDNCPITPVITYTDSDSDSTIIRTWTATDACNNTAIGDQIITVEEDTTGPEFDVPSSLTFWCNYSLPIPYNISDNCNTSAVTITYEFSNDHVQPGCPLDYSLYIIWTAVDENDNPTVRHTTITVQVTTEIFWTGPDTIEVLCNQDFDPSVLYSPQPSDQCDRPLNYTWEDSIDKISCETHSYNFTRTFTSESCITSSIIQIITVLPLPVDVCPCVRGYCDSKNKTCEECEKNWYGEYCQHPCKNCSPGTCDDGILGTGDCIMPSSPSSSDNGIVWSPGAIVGLTVLVVIIVGVSGIILYMLCHNRISSLQDDTEVLLVL